MDSNKTFLTVKRTDLSLRSPRERKKDFRHFFNLPQQSSISKQASRCMDCGVPFCHTNFGCPLGNLIPDWNRLIREQRWQEALESLHATNNFPEFTGVLCPAPCENACVLSLIDKPVAIKDIEFMLVHLGFENGWIKPEIHPKRNKGHVAIVGSGPAGLACAQQLVRSGFEVTVFEREGNLGGLLRYGIPDFKLEKSIIDRRIDQLFKEGVRFETGIELGRNISLQELQDGFHAVGLAIGAAHARDLTLEGRHSDGVYQAMEFLLNQNLRTSGDPSRFNPEISAKGKRVVVIGGGDTGLDCVGTAIRQNAINVTQIELQPQYNSPNPVGQSDGWPFEKRHQLPCHVKEEGGTHRFGILTKKISANQNGRVQHIIAAPFTGDSLWHSEDLTTFDADLVVLAVGFDGIEKKSVAGTGIYVNERGNIGSDTNTMTSVEGVFVAGDAARGASLIVWAIAEGRKMAENISRYVRIS